VLLVLVPDMARRRERAEGSIACGFEGKPVRALLGRSGVLGQGIAMVASGLKGWGCRGGEMLVLSGGVDMAARRSAG
jgi:hypothetical protein